MHARSDAWAASRASGIDRIPAGGIEVCLRGTLPKQIVEGDDPNEYCDGLSWPGQTDLSSPPLFGEDTNPRIEEDSAMNWNSLLISVETGRFLPFFVARSAL